MKSAASHFFLLLVTVNLTAQNSFIPIRTTAAKFSPVEKTIFHKTGQTLVPIKVVQYGNKADLVFVNMHDNEFTSVSGTKPILESRGGLLIRIENKRQRNISFKMENRTYVVDPNRIFTKEGAAVSLRENGRGYSNDRAAAEANRLGQRILELIPDSAKCVFALHNNYDKEFSIEWYKPGQKREADSRRLYIDSLEDPDDLILTTDSFLYEQIAAKRYNVVYQDNLNARKDGSLSVHFGEKGKPYINLETEHGKTKKYNEIMGFLCSLFEPGEAVTKEEAIKYPCILPPGAVPGSKTPVRFGEKEIGWLQTGGFNPATSQYNGVLHLKKENALFTNADLFVLQTDPDSLFIELRIDPTRERKEIPAGYPVTIKAQ